MSNSAPPTSVYLGVDVAKATLDGCCSKQQFASIPNNPKGHLQLLAQTSQLFPGSLMHLVCEATGGYEQALVRAATAAGWKVSIVSPSRVRHFAKACGLLAKTDTIDAKLILNFAETVQPLRSRSFPPGPKTSRTWWRSSSRSRFTSRHSPTNSKSSLAKKPAPPSPASARLTKGNRCH